MGKGGSMQSMVNPLFHCVSMGYIWVTGVCVAGGGSAVLSLLFVYPEFPNTKLLAI